MTTIGKYRHLMHASSISGVFNIIAIDHRAVLRDKLNEYTAEPITDAAFAAFKNEVVAALLPSSTAILTDPAFGIGGGVASRVITGQAGLLAPMEVTDYSAHPSKRGVNFIPDWTVDKIKRAGGDGVKLLMQWNPDSDDTDEKLSSVQQIIDDCTHNDIPFYLEPIAYSPDPEHKLTNSELLDIMVSMSTQFSQMGVDVLKLQFPVDVSQSMDKSEWEAACKAVDEACSVPWVLLSAGVGFDVFAQQAEVACANGASGVIVGRAVWQEAVELQGDARREFLNTTAKERMNTLAQICEQHATPWFDRVTAPDASMNWYMD